MTDVKDRAADFIKAFNAHDDNTLRGLNHPDHVLIAPGGVDLRGTETLGYATAWLKACPDGKLTVENELVSGPWVVDEVRFEGTHQGPLEGPMGTIEATGRKLSVKAAMVTRYENGLAIETRIYFDQAEVLSQLGAITPPVPATV